MGTTEALVVSRRRNPSHAFHDADRAFAPPVPFQRSGWNGDHLVAEHNDRGLHRLSRRHRLLAARETRSVRRTARTRSGRGISATALLRQAQFAHDSLAVGIE